MIPDISRRQALGILAAPFVVGCRGLDLMGPASNGPEFSTATRPITLIGGCDQHAVATVNRVHRERTAAMVKSVLDADSTAWAFNAGDLVFHGTAEQYREGYHPSWGAFRSRTLFALGNHDRMSDPTARPFYEYTGAEPYYARTLGSWRIYVLNTEGAEKGGASSVQQRDWLKADIARYTKTHHIMAMWHYPMYSNVCDVHDKAMVWPGKVGPWWEVLTANGAEFVISGHVHRWERFRRMVRSGVQGGVASSKGIRQFVVGTGGGNLYGVLKMDPNCERAIVARGVARFDLYPDRYKWTFTDTSGVVRDSGTQLCRKVLAA